jgi:outer membrane protein assembly factor BamE (lipoprotein component of BamABCDE complex)
MNLITRLFLTLSVVSVIAGCALPGSIPLNSTNADDLLKRMGKPTETTSNPAGGEYWDYVYGPAGFETWRFGIDGGRVVRSREQLITFERLHQVKTGTSTEKDVRVLLGKPSMVTRLQNQTAWEWRVNFQPGLGYFVVNFDANGIAQSTAVLNDFIGDWGPGDH